MKQDHGFVGGLSRDYEYFRFYGKYVVAEGIETKEQVDLLLELNCKLGQGFYFGRPVSYDEWQLETFEV